MEGFAEVTKRDLEFFRNRVVVAESLKSLGGPIQELDKEVSQIGDRGDFGFDVGS
ncbi:hypothetical protein [Rosistilla oblonga]|uniref:hypothetical protein n=1 Tax=Rosistilla oblonga TaxID=2527990 RepID=UPI003A969F95